MRNARLLGSRGARLLHVRQHARLRQTSGHVGLRRHPVHAAQRQSAILASTSSHHASHDHGGQLHVRLSRMGRDLRKRQGSHQKFARRRSEQTLYGPGGSGQPVLSKRTHTETNIFSAQNFQSLHHRYNDNRSPEIA